MVNNIIKKPLSPHLQVYRIQITSLLSISHRMSGVFLFFGFLLYSWCFILYTFFTNSFAVVFSNHYLGFISKIFALLFLFSLIYHLLNGVRHLLWDLGINLTNKGVLTTGIIVMFLFLLFSSLSAFLIFY